MEEVQEVLRATVKSLFDEETADSYMEHTRRTMAPQSSQEDETWASSPDMTIEVTDPSMEHKPMAYGETAENMTMKTSSAATPNLQEPSRAKIEARSHARPLATNPSSMDTSVKNKSLVTEVKTNWPRIRQKWTDQCPKLSLTAGSRLKLQSNTKRKKRKQQSS